MNGDTRRLVLRASLDKILDHHEDRELVLREIAIAVEAMVSLLVDVDAMQRAQQSRPSSDWIDTALLNFKPTNVGHYRVTVKSGLGRRTIQFSDANVRRRLRFLFAKVPITGEERVRDYVEKATSSNDPDAAQRFAAATLEGIASEVRTGESRSIDEVLLGKASLSLTGYQLVRVRRIVKGPGWLGLWVGVERETLYCIKDNA